MKHYFFEYMITVCIIAIVGILIVFLFNHEAERTAKLDAYYGACTYVGNRVGDGWGPAKVYQYICNGVPEETTYNFLNR